MPEWIDSRGLTLRPHTLAMGQVEDGAIEIRHWAAESETPCGRSLERSAPNYPRWARRNTSRERRRRAAHRRCFLGEIGSVFSRVRDSVDKKTRNRGRGAI